MQDFSNYSRIEEDMDLTMDNLLKSCKIECMERRILLVSVNDRSYTSYRYFAKQLSDALQRKGCRIGWCRLEPGEGQDTHAWGKALFQAQAFHADAVVDFNSFLPKISVDGKCLPEVFEAPFYNYVLDHPIYHKKALEAKLSDYRCICVDELHEVYIKKYYPHIRSVFTNPIPGSVGRNAEHPFIKRKKRILFCGTYEEPERYLQLMRKLPKKMADACMELGQQMLEDSDGMMGDALNPGNAEYCFLADAYARHERRKRIIRTLLHAGLPIDLYGNGWEALHQECQGKSNAMIHDSIMYSDYVNKLGEYQIALNIMPRFVLGSHDRITCAMYNKAAVLTDENAYVHAHYDSGLNHGAVVAAFSVNDGEKLCELGEKLLKDTAWTEQLALRGTEYGKRYHTWDALAERILADMG